MFESLSDTQKKAALEKTGKFVLRACPGSGKTYTVSARLANQISTWSKKHSGIAAVSFTNIACEEIRGNMTSFEINDVEYPHYIGTIDSFINRYIFLPFGHLLLGCASRPELVGQPYSNWSYPKGQGWKAYRDYFDLYSFNINDDLIKVADTSRCTYGNKPIGGTKHEEHLIKAKRELFKEGYVNQSDAIYFAVKVLEKYPTIAKSLVKRFPVLIVDEAQDTSAIHMRVIDLLIEAGLSEVMLVGDPDQAIYEWNDAEPKLFKEKESLWDKNSVVLNQNRRSGQTICDVTHALSTLENISESISEDKESSRFEIIGYDDKDLSSLQKIKEEFLRVCDDEGLVLGNDKVHILVRSNNFKEEVVKEKKLKYENKSPWVTGDKFSKDFIEGCHAIDIGDFKQGYNLLCKAFCFLFSRKRKDVDSVTLNKYVWFIKSKVPVAEGEVSLWLKKASAVEYKKGMTIPVQVDGDYLDKDFIDLSLGETKSTYTRGVPISTIHGVKGETHDATLLILRSKPSGNGYKRRIEEVTSGNDEELRIVYVALTRPRKVLFLAVPNKDVDIWKGFLGCV